MNKLFLYSVFSFWATITFAQKETFDIVNYTAPKNWKKEVTENITSYTISNKKINKWCRINIIKSTSSKGNIDLDFESEWQEMVVSSYKPTEAPKLNEVQQKGDWKIKAGTAKFTSNNGDAMVLLTTATGYNRCVSIVTITNSQDHLKDIEALLTSVDLKKIETFSPVPVADEKTTANKTTLAGTWGLDNTTASMYNTGINEGSTSIQYMLYANGTYTFHVKTFRYHWDKLLLTKESGTYQVNGNNLTIIPKASVVEAWTRKNGTNEFGKLVSSDKKALEKTTYQFEVSDFGSGNVLILKAAAATKRDGPFNNSQKDAWYYPAKSKLYEIKLPQ